MTGRPLSVMSRSVTQDAIPIAQYTGSATASARGPVKSFFWRWQRRLPSPVTAADLRADYAYDLAFRQLELSDIRAVDRPQAGRAFFESVIRDHLELGRLDGVAFILDRRVTRSPALRVRTTVITNGVDPQCRTTALFTTQAVLRGDKGSCAPRR
jgi:hypothetical protein